MPIDKRAGRLTSQLKRVEMLSRHVYQRLAINTATRHLFEDSRMDAFWQLQERERSGLWGIPLDITRIN